MDLCSASFISTVSLGKQHYMRGFVELSPWIWCVWCCENWLSSALPQIHELVFTQPLADKFALQSKNNKIMVKVRWRTLKSATTDGRGARCCNQSILYLSSFGRKVWNFGRKVDASRSFRRKAEMKMEQVERRRKAIVSEWFLSKVGRTRGQWP